MQPVCSVPCLKPGIAGVYHFVSAKHLQSYVNEYAFRYNHRDDSQAMFQTVRERGRSVRQGRYGASWPVGASVSEPLTRFGAGMDRTAVEDKDSNAVEV